MKEEGCALFNFLQKKLRMNREEAEQFISEFRHHDAIDYGYNIVQNHRNSFIDSFDTDSIDEDTFAQIAIECEDISLSEMGDFEYDILKDIFHGEFGITEE